MTEPNTEQKTPVLKNIQDLSLVVAAIVTIMCGVGGITYRNTTILRYGLGADTILFVVFAVAGCFRANYMTAMIGYFLAAAGLITLTLI